MNASKCSCKSENITGGVFRIAAFLTYFIFECSIHIHRKLFTSGGIGTVSRKALQPLRVETEENSLREFLVKSLS